MEYAQKKPHNHGQQTGFDLDVTKAVGEQKR
jgi:hypothetical protein